MSTLQDNDLFVYQEAATGETKAVANSNRSSLDDEDLFVVYRPSDAKNYKVKSSDVGGGAADLPNVANVELTQVGAPNTNRFTNNSFTSTVTNDGGQAAVSEMTAKVVGQLGVKAGSSPITDNPYIGTAAGTSVSLTLEDATNLGDPIEVGDTVTANVSYTPTTSTIDSIENDLPLTVTADGNYTGWSWDYVWTEPENVVGNKSSNAAYIYNLESKLVLDNATTGTFEFLCRSGSGSGPIAGMYIRVKDSQGNETGTRITVFPTAAEGCNWLSINAVDGKEIEIGGQDPGIIITDIKIAGKLIKGVEGGFDLTLVDETDIKLFQVGDMVQGSILTVSTNDGVFATDRGADKGFDGNGATLCASENLGISPVGTHWIEVIFGAGVDVESEINLKFWTSSHQNQISINGGAYQPIAAAIDVSIPFTGKLYSVRFSSTSDSRNGGAFSGIGYDGTILTAENVSTQLNNPVNVGIDTVEILSTNVSAKTITVDGGNWGNYNNSKVWSNNLNSTSVQDVLYPIQNVFNGDVTSEWDTLPSVSFSAPSEYMVLDFTEFPNAKTVDIWYVATSGSGFSVEVNDTLISPFSVTGKKPVKATVDVTGVGLNKINWNGVSGTVFAGVAGIAVDGVMLVDKAPGNANYSDTAGWDASSSYGDPKFLFDGNVNTVVQPPGNKRTLTTGEFTGQIIKIQQNGVTDNFTGWELTVNDVVYNPTGRISNQFYIYNLGEVKTINRLEYAWVDTPSDGPSYTVRAIFVDGAMLVDSNASKTGSTQVSTVSPKQGSGTVSSINSNVVTVSPYTDNCFKEGQYLTVDKTINVEPNTDPIASYTSGTKTLVFDGPTNLGQFANGDEVYMTDANGNPATFNAETDTISSVGTTTFDQLSGSYVYVSGTQMDAGRDPFANLAVIFDGNTGSFCRYNYNYYTPNTNGAWSRYSWVFTNPIPCSSVKIWCASYSDDAKSFVGINGNPGRRGGTATTQTETDFTADIEDGLLKSIELGDVSQNYASLSRIEVDGKVLLDTFDSVELSFSGDKDLQYFKAEDKVQGSLNQDKNWINFTSGTPYNGSYTWSEAFRGAISTNTNNTVFPFTNETLTFTPDVPVTDKVIVYAYTRTDLSTYGLRLNGTLWTPEVATYGHPHTFTAAQLGGTLSTVELINSGDTGCYLAAIEVDGKLLADPTVVDPNAVLCVTNNYPDSNSMVVDGGDWDTSNQSQVWSNYLTGVEPSIGLPATNLFDGDTATTAESAAGSPLTFIPPTGIPYTEKVECWIQSDGGSRNFSLNDGPDVPNLGIAWTEVATGSGTINKLVCQPDPNRNPAWSAIRVDGRLLIDKGIRDLGDNTVKITKSGTGTVDSVDVSTNSMVLSESNDQWIEDYHVGTASKPAVTSTAYLQFDSTGAVSGYQATPVAPIAMDNKLSPTLTFPAEFESLQKTPDEEFSDTSAYLQTNVKLTNIVGSSNKDSNTLVPTTTSTFAIHECDVCYNAEGVADMYANVLSKEIREATVRLINAEETVAQTLERVKTFVETYVDSESH